jgi:integrase
MKTRKLHINPTLKNPYGDIIQNAIDSAGQGASMARRRLQNPEPYMNRTKNLWIASYAEYLLDPNGTERRQRRQITLGPTATMSKREASRKLRPILDKVNAAAFNPTPTKKSIALDAFTEIWKRDVLSLKEPSTQPTMRGHVERLKERFGARDMRSITAGDIRQFIAIRKIMGNGPKTLRNLWITIRLIWTAAKKQDFVDDTPAKPDLPGRTKTKPRYFTLREVGQIIRFASQLDRMIYWLAAETGLRAGELAGLKLTNEICQNRIEVKQSVWNGKAGTPKTANAVRTIAISGYLYKEIRNYELSYDNYEAGIDTDNFLLKDPIGKPWDPNSFVKQNLQPLLNTMGIQRAGLHAFRHFNASLMDSLGVPLKTRQERLGHAATGSLTLDVYTHSTWEANVKAAETLGEKIWEAVNAESFDSLTAANENGSEVEASKPLVVN